MRTNNNGLSAAISMVLIFILGISEMQAQPYWNRFGGNTTSSTEYIGLSDGSANSLKLKTVNNLPIELFTNNIQRLTIAANGYVGIGTDSPAYSLHVNGTIAAKQILIETNSETKDLLALITQLQAEVAELKQQFIAFGKN